MATTTGMEDDEFMGVDEFIDVEECDSVWIFEQPGFKNRFPNVDRNSEHWNECLKEFMKHEFLPYWYSIFNSARFSNYIPSSGSRTVAHVFGYHHFNAFYSEIYTQLLRCDFESGITGMMLNQIEQQSRKKEKKQEGRKSHSRRSRSLSRVKSHPIPSEHSKETALKHLKPLALINGLIKKYNRTELYGNSDEVVDNIRKQELHDCMTYWVNMAKWYHDRVRAKNFRTLEDLHEDDYFTFVHSLYDRLKLYLDRLVLMKNLHEVSSESINILIGIPDASSVLAFIFSVYVVRFLRAYTEVQSNSKIAEEQPPREARDILKQRWTPMPSFECKMQPHLSFANFQAPVKSRKTDKKRRSISKPSRGNGGNNFEIVPYPKPGDSGVGHQEFTLRNGPSANANFIDSEYFIQDQAQDQRLNENLYNLSLNKPMRRLVNKSRQDEQTTRSGTLQAGPAMPRIPRVPGPRTDRRLQSQNPREQAAVLASIFLSRNNAKPNIDRGMQPLVFDNGADNISSLAGKMQPPVNQTHPPNVPISARLPPGSRWMPGYYHDDKEEDEEDEEDEDYRVNNANENRMGFDERLKRKMSYPLFNPGNDSSSSDSDDTTDSELDSDTENTIELAFSNGQQSGHYHSENNFQREDGFGRPGFSGSSNRLREFGLSLDKREQNQYGLYDQTQEHLRGPTAHQGHAIYPDAQGSSMYNDLRSGGEFRNPSQSQRRFFNGRMG